MTDLRFDWHPSLSSPQIEERLDVLVTEALKDYQSGSGVEPKATYEDSYRVIGRHLLSALYCAHHAGEGVSMRFLLVLLSVLTLTSTWGCTSLRTGKVPLGTHGSRVVSRYQGTPLRIVSQSNVAAVTKYTVRSGDTLWGIAQAHGVTLADLKRANSIDKPRELSIGQVLVVPGAIRLGPGQSVAGVSRDSSSAS